MQLAGAGSGREMVLAGDLEVEDPRGGGLGAGLDPGAEAPEAAQLR